MKNRGFTLIELLAVIVILAIIALIATPIVLGIIDNAREESGQRSIELYANAVEQAVVRFQLNPLNGNLTYGEFTMENNGKTLKDSTGKTLTVDVDGPNISCAGGTIIINDDGTIQMQDCKINGEGSYNYGINLTKVCTLSEENTYNQNIPSSGDPTPYIQQEIITCDEEKFYVMEKTDSTITMMAKYNLNINASPYYKQDTTGAINPVWYSGETSAEYGPNAIPYSYVETYEGYLRDTVGLTTVDAKLLSIEQATSLLGYVKDSERYKPTLITPSWAYSTKYWLIDEPLALGVHSDTNIGYAESSGPGGKDPSENGSAWGQGFGIRPVVTISAAQVEGI